MQTPKSRATALEVPRRKSPAATPRTAWQLKTPGSESDSVSSPNSATRTPKEKSPKVTERKSPRSPATEKKRPSRLSELDSQLAQLQEELNKSKDQLNTSESLKRRSQQEAEDTKKRLLTMSAKLEESQQQLMELSASEDARVQELCKISHDRDKAWESELEAVQKQHSIDSAALGSAMNEIQKLKNQLEMVAESEATHAKHAESAHAELQGLRKELTETLSLVEKLRNELSDSRESEARALDLVSEAQRQLDAANAVADILRAEGVKTMEAHKSLSSELEQSNAQVRSLEAVVNKLQAELANSKQADAAGDVEYSRVTLENDDTNQLKAELDNLKFEVGQLKSALKASETRYQEEHIRNTLQIRSAYEQVEQTKIESGKKEAEIEAELEKAKADVEQLRANLMNKENELQNLSEENSGLNMKIEKNQSSEREFELENELKKFEQDLAELKATLLDKETQLQGITEQNEMLKGEITKAEMEKSKANGEALELAETGKAAEREALMKLGYLTEEAEKSSRKAARVTEQLDAAQAVNAEMEAELRKLKVQADQWRKAAEAAAAILSTGNNNGKFVERTGSLDIRYSPIAGNMESPYSEDLDDDSPKKKNGNMLKKIGVLWKKGQK